LPDTAVGSAPLHRETAFFLMYRILTDNNVTIWTRIGNEVPHHFPNAPPFGDSNDITPSKRHAVFQLHRYGIVTGYSNGDVLPQFPFSRLTAAVILSNAVTPSTEIPMPWLIDPFLTPFSSFHVGEGAEDLAPVLGESYSLKTTPEGAFSFIFTVPEDGMYSFTISDNAAARIYTMDSRPLSFLRPPLLEITHFPPLYFIPELLGDSQNSTQVRHRLTGGEDILIAIRGTDAQNFTITIDRGPGFLVVWPVALHSVNSPFGWREFDRFEWVYVDGVRSHRVFVERVTGNHWGVDIPVHRVPVHAIMDGEVVFQGWWGGNSGETVRLLHDNGYRTKYMHLSRIDVTEGDYVKAGEQIAVSGDTGTPGAFHLHFDLWRPGSNVQRDVAINPIEWWHWYDPREIAGRTNPNPFFIFRDDMFVFNPDFVWGFDWENFDWNSDW